MSLFGRNSLLGLSVVAALAAGALGMWQLDRLAGRREVNGLALAQRDLSPIDLNRERPRLPLNFRRVEVEGEYDPDHEFLLRGRLLLGTPGVQVITPLRVRGRDTAVLVNRGFVPSPDAGRPPPEVAYEEDGAARIRGVALPAPDEGDGAPLASTRGETWQRLDLSAMRSRLPYPVAPYYVIVEPDSGSGTAHTTRGTVLPVRIEPPRLDDGPHLAYAIQWFLIGAAALGFGVAVVRRRGPPGRAPT